MDLSQFKKPHRGDIRESFVEACKRARINDLHIHDLRHLGPSILLAQGVPDAVVAKVTGHRSAALKRYQHLSESFRKQTVDLIASVLTAPAGDTRTDTARLKGTVSASQKRCKGKESKRLHGRPVGTRTPDLYRVNLSRLGFSTTYKTAGTAKVRGSRTRHRFLWVGIFPKISVFSLQYVKFHCTKT